MPITLSLADMKISVRLVLMVVGISWLILHEGWGPLSQGWQMGLFLIGILTLGVPHGAADLLVEMRNRQAVAFPLLSFLARYLARLALFASVLFFFPTLGLGIFILIAAFHFGETDLSALDAQGFTGKLAILLHGLSILGIILLGHGDALKPYLALAGSGRMELSAAMGWLHAYGFWAMIFICLAAFLAMAVHCIRHPVEWNKAGRQWALFYLPMAIILWRLPLLEGFTFYFISWHSVLSLDCIVGYLCRSGAFSRRKVIAQIGIFSAIAFLGILAVGLAGFMFASSTTMAWYVFMGLAVLTAPHMEVMHHMYHRLRSSTPSPAGGLVRG